MMDSEITISQAAYNAQVSIRDLLTAICNGELVGRRQVRRGRGWRWFVNAASLKEWIEKQQQPSAASTGPT